jgi:hypothetical protein
VVFDVVVVLAGVVVGVDPIALEGPERSTPVFCNVDAGESCDVAMNVIEPTTSATEPSTAHDHHTRYSGCRELSAAGEGGHCWTDPRVRRCAGRA